MKEYTRELSPCFWLGLRLQQWSWKVLISILQALMIIRLAHEQACLCASCTLQCGNLQK